MPRPLTAIRWTLPEAAAEFHIDPKTLAKRVKAQGILPGGDGRYSTLQMCAAKFGNLDGAKLRVANAQAKKLERENAEADRELLPTELVERFLSATFIAVRQAITATHLPEETKSRALKLIAEEGEAIMERFFTEMEADLEPANADA